MTIMHRNIKNVINNNFYYYKVNFDIFKRDGYGLFFLGFVLKKIKTLIILNK